MGLQWPRWRCWQDFEPGTCYGLIYFQVRHSDFSVGRNERARRISCLLEFKPGRRCSSTIAEWGRSVGLKEVRSRGALVNANNRFSSGKAGICHIC